MLKQLHPRVSGSGRQESSEIAIFDEGFQFLMADRPNLASFGTFEIRSARFTLLESVALHWTDERLACEAQIIRGLGLVSVGAFEGTPNLLRQE